MTFRKNLEVALSSAGKTKADLARHLGIEGQAISQWQGDSAPKVSRLLIIADYLECSVDFLLRGHDNVPKGSLPSQIGEPVETANKAALLRFWDALDEDDARDLVVRIIEVIADWRRPSSSDAA